MDWFINILIWMSIFCSWVTRTLLWPIRRYPRHWRVVVLAVALIAYFKAQFAGGLSAPTSVFILLFLIGAFAKSLVAILPQGTAPELVREDKPGPGRFDIAADL